MKASRKRFVMLKWSPLTSKLVVFSFRNKTSEFIAQPLNTRSERYCIDGRPNVKKRVTMTGIYDYRTGRFAATSQPLFVAFLEILNFICCGVVMKNGYTVRVSQIIDSTKQYDTRNIRQRNKYVEWKPYVSSCESVSFFIANLCTLRIDNFLRFLHFWRWRGSK